MQFNLQGIVTSANIWHPFKIYLLAIAQCVLVKFYFILANLIGAENSYNEIDISE
jgi:hypothetical protein